MRQFTLHAVCHQRLAHISYKTISKMHSLNLVDGLLLQDNRIQAEPCLGCAYGKMMRSPFPVGRTRATQSGQLIHSDVCGPIYVTTPGGAKFFTLFTGDYSGWRVVFFIRQKSDVAECFKSYVCQVRTETGNLINTLRADNGGEFIGHTFKQWLTDKEIHLETSAPYTQNRTEYPKELIRPSSRAHAAYFMPSVYP